MSASVRHEVEKQKSAAETAPAVQREELTAHQWFERGFSATDVDEKLRFCSEALRLKPDFAEAFCLRGFALKGKGDLDGAVRDYTEAIRLKPDLAEPFYFRGLGSLAGRPSFLLGLEKPCRT